MLQEHEYATIFLCFYSLYFLLRFYLPCIDKPDETVVCLSNTYVKVVIIDTSVAFGSKTQILNLRAGDCFMIVLIKMFS